MVKRSKHVNLVSFACGDEDKVEGVVVFDKACEIMIILTLKEFCCDQPGMVSVTNTHGGGAGGRQRRLLLDFQNISSTVPRPLQTDPELEIITLSGLNCEAIPDYDGRSYDISYVHAGQTADGRGYYMDPHGDPPAWLYLSAP